MYKKFKPICDHTCSIFYDHISNAPRGQRCTKCGKQEWF